MSIFGDGIGGFLGGGLVGTIFGGGSSSGGYCGGITPRLLGGIIEENPDAKLLKEVGGKIFEILFEPSPTQKQTPAITETEKNRIIEIIEEGRKRGCRELRIRISKDHSQLFAANGKIIIDLPLDISARIEESDNSELCIVVTYFEHDPAVRISQLHDLLQKGAITQEDYDNAKTSLLARM